MTTAHITRSGETVDIAWLGGSVHHILLRGADTGGRITALRSTMHDGAASPVHVHDRDDETVFVITGTGTFWAGTDRWDLTSGDTAFLPRGIPHTYAFASGEVELLTVCNPAGMDDFFERAGWDLRNPLPEGWAVDMAKLAEAGEANGQHVLGPPLAPGEVMPESYLAR